jgi:hypothetical protein
MRDSLEWNHLSEYARDHHSCQSDADLSDKVTLLEMLKKQSLSRSQCRQLRNAQRGITHAL